MCGEWNGVRKATVPQNAAGSSGRGASVVVIERAAG
jgi:hypothetical protein